MLQSREENLRKEFMQEETAGRDLCRKKPQEGIYAGRNRRREFMQGEIAGGNLCRKKLQEGA